MRRKKRKRSVGLWEWLSVGTICACLTAGIFCLLCWPQSPEHSTALPEVSAEGAASYTMTPLEGREELLYPEPEEDLLALPALRKPVQITAHRGDSAHWPENTLPAFLGAASAEADWVELDVQATADGELVAFHDDSLYRITGIGKYIWNCTMEELEGMDAGAWMGPEHAGTPIPRLSEVLDACKDQVRVNVEIKENLHEMKNPITLQVVQMIEDRGMADQCMITAYMQRTLRLVKELNPAIKTALLCETGDRFYYDAPEIDVFSVWSPLVTQEIVERSNAAGKRVAVWPVDSGAELERVAALGVDNVITDDPGMAIALLYGENGCLSR